MTLTLASIAETANRDRTHTYIYKLLPTKHTHTHATSTSAKQTNQQAYQQTQYNTKKTKRQSDSNIYQQLHPCIYTNISHGTPGQQLPTC